MPGERLEWDILAHDHASRQFRDVGRAAAEAGAKMDFAAASLKTFDAATIQSGKAAKTSEQAIRSHVKADQLFEDAMRVAGGQATKFTKLMTDQGRQLDQTGKSTIGLRARFEALAGSGGTGLGGTGMAALVGAGVALSGQLTTLAFGLGGLGLAAAGVIKPITDAAQASGGLAKNLHTLDPAQQKTARGFLDLGKQYAAFSKSLEPQVLAAVNDGFRIAGHLLADVQPVAKQAGIALDQVLGSIDREFQSGTWQQFFQFMAQEAGPDTRQLGQLFTDLLHTIPPLVEDLHPLGSAIITVADDAVQATDKIRNFYDSFQRNVPISNVHTANFLKDLDRDVVSLTNHIPGARAVNDWLTGIQHDLTGTGTAAQKSVPPVQHATQALSDMKTTTVTTVTPVDHLGKAAASTSFTISEYGKNANLAVTPVDHLGKATQVTVRHLTDAGQVAAYDAQIYAQEAKELDRLATSYTHALTPLQNYIGAQITERDDLKQLNQALRESHDRIGLKTQAERNSYQAAQTYIDQTVKTGQAAVRTGHGIQGQIDTIERALPRLQSVKGKTADYKRELDLLKNILDRLRAEKLIREQVRVTGSGSWSTVGTGPFAGKVTGFAGGTGGAAPGWAWVGERGPELVNMRGGETVLPHTQSVAVTRGYASGVIGSYSGGPGGLPPWTSHNQQATVEAITAGIARTFASQFKAAMSGAFTDSGARSGNAAVAQAYARALLPAYGWGPEQFPPLVALWNQESGWNAYAVNPSSGAAGIPQALGHGHVFNLGDYKAQIRWGLGYIRSVYGTPGGAEAHELAFNWYDRGGLLPPGLSLAYNGTGRPEPVTPGGRGAGNVYHITVNVAPTAHKAEIGREVVEAIREFERRSGAGWRR